MNSKTWVTFIENGVKLKGELKSQANNYLQVIVEQQEYIITSRQVKSMKKKPEENSSDSVVLVPKPFEPTPLVYIVQAIKESMTTHGHSPSKALIAERLQISVTDLNKSLTSHNVSDYGELLYQIRFQNFPQLNPQLSELSLLINRPPLTLEIINEELIKLMRTTYKIPSLMSLVVASKYSKKAIESLFPRPVAQQSLKLLPEAFPGQVMVPWLGRLIKVSIHAVDRAEERFQLEEAASVFFETALSKVAELEQTPETKRYYLRKYGRPVRNFANYQQDIIFIVSIDLREIHTVLIASQSQWAKHHVNALTWISTPGQLKPKKMKTA